MMKNIHCPQLRVELRYTPLGVDPKEVHDEDPHLHWHAGASVDTPYRAVRTSFPGETLFLASQHGRQKSRPS
ncbi:MAG: hypothetical protein M3R47_10490 [Chloroflexota bacterium]|nr:hypothetical protein [Chloroflexota bacterium]